MTLELNPNRLTYDLYVNIINYLEDKATLIVKSQYSNTILFQTILSTQLSNERYTYFEFETDLDLTNDINGIYEYIIVSSETTVFIWNLNFVKFNEETRLFNFSDNSGELDGNTIDFGLIKIINKGNELETLSYISNNEERKAKILYRPNN